LGLPDLTESTVSALTNGAGIFGGLIGGQDRVDHQLPGDRTKFTGVTKPGGLAALTNQVLLGVSKGNNPFKNLSVPVVAGYAATLTGSGGIMGILGSSGGPNYATVSACASSTNAIIDAFNLIRLRKADAIVCGGSEAAVNEMGMGGFNALKALSTRNDSPETASRPFDVDRDGFILGEGAGALILEDYDHAMKRGAKIYAEVVGGGMSGDAYHMTAPHPEGLGAKNTMLAALEDAEMNPSEIDYVNVHGTSTPLGDVAEIKAIEAVFGEHAYNMNISSTKSMTGHLLGAAGAIEAIACILAVKNDLVPPTINHFTADPELDPKLNFTFNKAQKRVVNVALSNTFGFGGHNTSVIVKKFIG
jgi:3-oxoacyl-[acyl-carrier-protein] synthase II